MEKSIRLKGTKDTPAVILDKELNEFVLSGRSLPEDALSFYEPIISWMKDYAMHPNMVTEIQFKLDYFNSSSVKQILTILTILRDIIKTGKEAKVLWYYDQDDELMESKGREFESMLKIPFEFRMVRSDEVSED